MKNVKNLIFALSIFILFINADCNKVEETPVFNGYILEGQLVTSCFDNTPLKNRTFLLRDENDKLNNYSIAIKTDSIGFFKINSELKGKNLIMEDGFGIGKTILYKIPGGKSIDFGEIAYNYTIPVTFKYKNFSKLTDNDSLFIEAHATYGNSFKIKGPFISENLGFFYIKTEQPFENYNVSNTFIFLYKNNLNINNLIQKKNFINTPRGISQEIIFE
jgi:hypothetical protein